MQTKAFLPSSTDFSLKKTERLCSKKAFEFLFSHGTTVFVHPLKVIFSVEPSESGPSCKVAFGVSKRNFKKAVKRNRIKRLLREAYRKHKLVPQKNHHIHLMIMYISKTEDSYQRIETTLIKALEQVAGKIEKHT